MAGFKSYGCLTFLVNKLQTCLPFSNQETNNTKRSKNKRVKIDEHSKNANNNNTNRKQSIRQSSIERTGSPDSYRTRSNSRKTSNSGVEKTSSSYSRKINDVIDLDDTSRTTKYVAKASITVDKPSSGKDRWKRGMTLIKEKKQNEVFSS